MSRIPKLATFAIVLALLPTPAFAYIDPAVGSMMLQGLLAAIAMAGAAWYTLRLKMREFLTNARTTLSALTASKK